MATYSVALWVKYPDGNEGRYDTNVEAEDRNDAVHEAKSELPSGTKVLETISVE